MIWWAEFSKRGPWLLLPNSKAIRLERLDPRPGCDRQALNNLVNEKGGISPEMAVRLTKAFGGTAETWLRMQAIYDLAHVSSAGINVKPYRKAS